MHQERDSQPSRDELESTPRSAKRRLAGIAYVFCVIVTVISFDLPLLDRLISFADLDRLGPGVACFALGLYPLEFAAFLCFRRFRVGNKYLSLVLMCLSGAVIALFVFFALVVAPFLSHMNLAPS